MSTRPQDNPTVPAWTVLPLGDSALLLKRGQSASAPPLTPPQLARLADWLREQAGGWIADCAPAYDSVAVYPELKRMPPRWFEEDGRHVLARAAEWLAERAKRFRPPAAADFRVVEVPVRYGGADGPDLKEAAARSGLSERRFIELHASAEYEVAMIGFAPGFPYLQGLPEPLAQPRKPTPRVRVPAGSVGIAGRQTGIYPIDSPGGWQIVGRTPMRLFRPEADPPFPIRPGDRVKFVPIAGDGPQPEASDRDRLDRADRTAQIRQPAQTVRPQPTEQTGPAGQPAPVSQAEHAALTVLEPGFMTTVQDLGRPGWRAYGVSAGGAMDREALRTANLLAGNPEGAAALELTLAGGKFRAEREGIAAIAGADLDARLDGEPLSVGRAFYMAPGAVLSFGRAVSGCRAYLAWCGGFQVPEALGSRSTDARAGFGGYRGRALAAGDALPGGEPPQALVPLLARLREQARRNGRRWAADRFAAAVPRLAPADGEPAGLLRLLPGKDWDDFTEEAKRLLLSEPFRVDPSSDRMGIRLRANAPLRRSRPAEPGSHGVAPGTVQIPPDGQPIVLAAGCQPTGGYPVAAHVLTADLPRLGQLKPGDRVRFRLADMREAMAALAAQERRIALLAAGLRMRRLVEEKGDGR